MFSIEALAELQAVAKTKTADDTVGMIKRLAGIDLAISGLGGLTQRVRVLAEGDAAIL